MSDLIAEGRTHCPHEERLSQAQSEAQIGRQADDVS